MTGRHAQPVLRERGITASPRQYAAFVVESVEAIEEGIPIPAAEELPDGEPAVLCRRGFESNSLVESHLSSQYSLPGPSLWRLPRQ